MSVPTCELARAVGHAIVDQNVAATEVLDRGKNCFAKKTLSGPSPPKCSLIHANLSPNAVHIEVGDWFFISLIPLQHHRKRLAWNFDIAKFLHAFFALGLLGQQLFAA